MPVAWLILAAAILGLIALELLPPPKGGLRPTAFLSALQPAPPQATPWPTPQALPVQPGVQHTSSRRIRQILATPPRGKRSDLRVAYFADSVTEGDLICGTLRQKLQERFGGQGLGWVGMAPIDAWARDNIQQKFDESWERRSQFKVGWQGQAFGPGGQAWYVGKSPGHVRFRGMPGLPAHAKLAPATLWYGPLGPDGADIEVKEDGKAKQLHITGAGPLNHAVLSVRQLTSLDLEISAKPDQAFFGVSFDEGGGLDNFSNRGSHGGPLQRMDLAMLQELQARRGYDLVLVQYGINALTIRNDPAYKWYRRELSAGLRQLQAGLPGASMLLVTALDHGDRQNGSWASDPFLPGLIAAQIAAAQDVGIPWVNGFDLMGGPGSMVRYVEGKPRMAEHDYTHLNPLGAKRFGESLWEALQQGGRSAEGKP